MSATYVIDPSHSTANFSIKHMMIAKVHGGFEKLSGTFSYDKKNPEASKVEALIEVASINTREAQRDAHLKSADFFDAEKFPSITFAATKFISNGAGELEVLGNLTIRGIAKQVTLKVDGPTDEIKDPWGNTKIGLSGTTKLKRKDFGLTWNAALETGGILVGEDVDVSLDIQFVKQDVK